MENSFYIGFSTFVQIAVAFCFGLLYLYKNTRSIFTSIQTVLYNAVCKNYFAKLGLSYPRRIANKVKVKDSKEFLRKWKGRLMQCISLYNAAPNKERICDHLAALGIVSGFYSIAWLLYVPCMQKIPHANDFYITLTVATIIADIWMVCYINKHKTRQKTFIYSVVVLVLSYGAALFLYKMKLTMDCPVEFDTFFLFSLAVPFAPVCFFILNLLYFIMHRLVVFVLTLAMAFLLHVYMFLWR